MSGTADEPAFNEREISRALSRASAGKALSVEEVAALSQARGGQLDELTALARHTRQLGVEERGLGQVITWSPKVFLPITKLCRDRCHYCTFVSTPAELRREGHSLFMEPDEILEVARAGQEAGCLEALFTLGDRPEDRWPVAQEWLDERGYNSTLDYVRAMAILVLEETGLLPHLNPGVMSWEELSRLRPVAPSMGMMLETTSRRLFETPGEAHYGSPDKDPAVRLRTLRDAGRVGIPFTSGVLMGIGETAGEFADSLLALRGVHREFGHIQEVIVQNFRAKPATAMARKGDLELDAYVAGIATARIVCGPKMRIQTPPNLTDSHELSRLLDAGIDDWGGISPVTADHVNPERPWPAIELVREATEAAGFELKPRLTAHPEYVNQPLRWLDPHVRSHVSALAELDGLARSGVKPEPLPWQAEVQDYEEFAAAEAGGQTDLHLKVDLEGRAEDRRSDFDEVYGDWNQLEVQAAHASDSGKTAGQPDGSLVAEGLLLANDDPAALADPANEQLAIALMSATGGDLVELATIADRLRVATVGEDVTFVVNRNINFTNVCYTGCRFCAFAQRKTDVDAYTLSSEQVADRVREARAAGATEVCMQGGIHPDLPGTAYFDLLDAIREADPEMHIHAFSPMEIVNGATRSSMSIRDWLAEAKSRGLGSIPGTAAEILDDEIRWVLTKGKLPADAWVEVVTTAHELGIRSSSTMMYGHVDAPIHWVRHLSKLRAIQDQTGGFTEFVGLPFVHHNAPLYLAGIARAGSSVRDDIAVAAMSRLMLAGSIDNIQASWVKLGDEGCARLLQAGANDLGGTLMEETISRMAGSEFGSMKTPQELESIAKLANRPIRQRSTLYELVDI